MVFTISFTYQSHGISFSDWVTLLTLCLAPLIAHIAAGVPTPVYLRGGQPRWHDRICLFNPTSILWRYLAIVDRRSRAKSWTSLDMAASNAIFWDGKWDGSEDMIQRSRDFCVRAPRHHHIEPLSGSTVVTFIVTLQGVQAIHSIVMGNAYSASVGINTIFYPLAALSLLRLPAAFWLTNDYIYRNAEEWNLPDSSELELGPNTGKQAESATALIIQPTMSSMESPVTLDRFHNHRGWMSALVRSFYLIMVMGLLALCSFELLFQINQGTWTATNFTLVLTFLLFLLFTTGIFLAYVILGRLHTTIIPCISAGWYKAYTGVLFTAMFLVFIIAAIETRKTPCGVYTTYPENSGGDETACGRSLFVGMPGQVVVTKVAVGTKQNGTTALQYTETPFKNTYGMALSAENGSVIVVAFDGWCRVNNPLKAANVSVFQPSTAAIGDIQIVDNGPYNG